MKEIIFFLILANIAMAGLHLTLANRFFDRGDKRRGRISYSLTGMHVAVVVIALVLTYPN